MDISSVNTMAMAVTLKNKPTGQGDAGGSIKGLSKLCQKHSKKSGEGNSSSSLDKSNLYCNYCKNIDRMKDKYWKLHPELLSKSLREKDKAKCMTVAMLTVEDERLEPVTKADLNLSLMVKLKDTGPSL